MITVPIKGNKAICEVTIPHLQWLSGSLFFMF